MRCSTISLRSTTIEFDTGRVLRSGGPYYLSRIDIAEKEDAGYDVDEVLTALGRPELSGAGTILAQYNNVPRRRCDPGEQSAPPSGYLPQREEVHVVEQLGIPAEVREPQSHYNDVWAAGGSADVPDVIGHWEEASMRKIIRERF
ncbi:hypothetical protein FGB62_72g05 [Gracilaria domingensis]|nr:hypothetical protein FGB62_72g05 [Gracilaria domingensis]